MARIKLGPMVTNISGSIGGVTIQRNRFGITMRQKPLPPKSATTAQYNVRQKIITIQKAWQNLTNAQRLQWDRFLDFSGQSIKADKSVKLSGQALYIKYQLYRLLAGFSLLTLLTYVPLPAIPIFAGLTLDIGILDVEINPSIDSTKLFFLFFITNPRHENRAPSKRGLRYMSTAIINGPIHEIQDAYIEAFGILPTIGTYIHFSIRFFSVLAPVYSGVFSGRGIVEA